MNNYQGPTPYDSPFVLATDLDGTFLPLDSSHNAALGLLAEQLRAWNRSLVFVTGRHYESTREAMDKFELPEPQWIICDVGTSVYRRGLKGEYELVEAYIDSLNQITARVPIAEVQNSILNTINHVNLQEQEKQGTHKLSFYVEPEFLEEVVQLVGRLLELENAPYSIVSSVDPFTGIGLLDVLPQGVSKAKALDWWLKHEKLDRESVVFAGDSGNDLTALQAGFLSIVVGNADRKIKHSAMRAHRQSGWRNRLYLAKEQATSGVLEGCRWFGLVGNPNG